MASPPDAAAALVLSARLCCAGILLQSLELALLWPELRNKHLLGWHGAQDARSFIRRLAQRAQAYPINAFVLLWRAFVSTLILVWPDFPGTMGVALLGTLVLSQLHFNRGGELFFANSDHVNLVCLAGLTVAAWPGASDALRGAGLAFVAFQACLAYLASGMDKLLAASWRSGLRLVHIVEDSSHHIPVLAAWFARRPGLVRPAAWLVIVLEVLFPLCVVLPPAAFWIVIAGGLLFHASIAVLMALPGFFWAFAATYPALYFVRSWIMERGW